MPVMQTVLEGGRAGARFLQPLADQQHARRRRKERCLLWLIQPLRVFRPRLEHAFGIITYHKIAGSAQLDRAMLNVTPPRFRQQMEGLLKLGYEPWPLQRVLEYEEAGEPIPREVFVVVFDDGFESVYLHAWPVLRQLRIPATIFLATAYLGAEQPFPFDTWTEVCTGCPAEQWRPLRIGQCHEMLDSGLVELGSHTHTHQDFRHRPGDLEQDLRESLHFLEREFNVETPSFSFPYGFADTELVAVAKQVGVRCGLTSESQVVVSATDSFAWGRFGAVDFDNAGSLAAKLDGWYSWVLDAKRRLRNGD